MPVWARTAWFGLAGSGDGLGVLGHAFVVFHEPGQEFLEADAYSYRVELTDPTGFSELLDLGLARIGLRGDVRFVAEKKTLGEYVLEYSGKQERDLRLFALKLTEQEVRAFEARLLVDVTNQAFAQNARFDAWSNNCLTRPIDHLNSVVDENRRIYLSQLGDKYLPSKEFLESPGAAILARMPTYLPVLMSKHPISANRRMEFGRAIRHRATVYLRELQPALIRVAKCRSWNDEFTTAVDSYLLYAARHPDVRVAAALNELAPLASCKADATAWTDLMRAFNNMLDKDHPLDVRKEVQKFIPGTGDKRKAAP